MENGLSESWSKASSINSSQIFTAQLAGKARQLGCPKIVLDHVRVLYMVGAGNFGRKLQATISDSPIS